MSFICDPWCKLVAALFNHHHSLGKFSRCQVDEMSKPIFLGKIRKTFFSFSPENRLWHIMHIVSLEVPSWGGFHEHPQHTEKIRENYQYSKTCVRQPPSKLTLVADVERWLSYKGTCHVILLAKLHDMYLYKTGNFFHISHYLKSVSKVALLHRFYCTFWLNESAYDLDLW